MPQRPRSQPVIFLAFANELGSQAIDGYLRKLADESRDLREILEPLRVQGMEIVYETNATLSIICDTFRKYRNRIVVFHFAGHANSYALHLEARGAESQDVNASGLAEFLKDQYGLQLVFLNACSTSGQVQALIRAGVPAVMATSAAIDDQVALEFAQHFYQSLMTGASLQTAFTEAQGQVRAARGEQTRQLYRPGATQAENRFPWSLEPQGQVRSWRLNDTINDPLFGVPPIKPRAFPASPYRNLNWFESAHAEVFFGRSLEIRSLYDQVTNPDSNSIILLYGQTGVGKSSLLAAGLTPRLEADFEVRYVRREQSLGALETLNTALEVTSEKPLVVILDQLEEVFTRAASENSAKQELNTLLERLVAIQNAVKPVKPILGFRKEYLPEIETALTEHKLSSVKVFLQPLSGDGVIEVVNGPARSERLQQHFHLSIEDELPQRIASDLEDRDSPIAPTLQILLSKMWEVATGRSPSAPCFDTALYESLEKDYAHLKGFLDQQLLILETWRTEIMTSGLALDLLAFHTTALGTAEEHLLSEIKSAYAHRQDMVDILQKTKDLYLIVDGSSEGQNLPDTRRLAHDTLAPLVREQFQSSQRPGQRARRILENRIKNQDPNTSEPGLLDEYDLSLVELGKTGMRQTTAAEEKLLERSRTARDQAIQDRERINRERRQARWLRYGTAAVALLGIGIAWFVIKNITTQTTAQSNARVVLEQARSLTQDQLDHALLLTLEANNISDTDFTRDRLKNILQSIDPHVLFRLHAHAKKVSSLAFSPDGTLLASASVDGQIILWDMSTNPPKLKLVIKQVENGLGNEIDTVTFNPTGTLLAAGGLNGNIGIWNLQGERQCIGKKNKDPQAYVRAIAFGHTGQELASGGNDGSVILWETSTCQQKVLRYTSRPVQSLAFGSGDLKLVSLVKETSCVAINKTDLSPLSTKPELEFTDKTQKIWNINFNPEGLRVTIGYVNSTKPQNITDQSPPSKTFSLLTDIVNDQCVSRNKSMIFPDDGEITSLTTDQLGQKLSSGHADGSIVVRTLGETKTSPKRPVALTLQAHYALVHSLAFSPMGNLLASGDKNGQIIVWDLKQSNKEHRIHDDTTALRLEACKLVSRFPKSLTGLPKADQTIEINQQQVGLDQLYKHNCEK